MKCFSILTLIAVANGITIQDDYWANSTNCTGPTTQHSVHDYSKCIKDTPSFSVIQSPTASCSKFVVFFYETPDCTGAAKPQDPIDLATTSGKCVPAHRGGNDSQMETCF